MVDNITNRKNSNIYMQKNTVIVNYLKIYKNTGQCRISLSDDVRVDKQVTGQVSCVEQELLNFPEHLTSPWIWVGFVLPDL